MLTVIIPSYNEENYITACLNSIISQTNLPENHGIQVIVAANGCKDRTVELAKERVPALEAVGFDFVILDIPYGNKMNAINEAEAQATYETRAFLDADVVISARVLRELIDVLASDAPRYASGTIRIPRPQSIVSRAYAKVWMNLPFVHDGVPGIGLYAVNASGRARWEKFPAIISDDRFVRLQFSPDERYKIKASYDWPLPEGFGNLVNVRHRWSEGNMELAEQFPHLISNDSQRNKTGRNVLGLLRTPLSSTIFVLIYLVSNIRARQTLNSESVMWRRGRN